MAERVSGAAAGSWRRVFAQIWAGQAVSLMGSGLSEYALSLWVYQQTQSVTQFAFVLLFRTLPVIALSPLAGVLADRWDRRRVMILSDAGSAVCTLLLAYLFATGTLQVWQVCVLTALGAAFGTLQTPAYLATISALVPGQDLRRVNGLLQLSQAIADIAVPVLAFSLIGAVQIPGILAIDVATFLVALATLWRARLPRQAHQPSAEPGTGSIAFFLDGLRHLRGRADLRRLLAFNAVFAFLAGLLPPLLIPLFTSLTSVQGMGIVLGIAGVGLLGGGLLMTTRGGLGSPRVNVLVGSTLFGIALTGAGLIPNIGWVAACAAAAHFTFPLVLGSSQALWQSAIALELQGRLHAVRQSILRGLQPLSLILAGVAVDRFFEPALAPGGVLADALGAWVGHGPGRGAALLVACVGIATLTLSLVTVGTRAFPRFAASATPDALGEH